jgi:hypothetical protein
MCVAVSAGRYVIEASIAASPPKYEKGSRARPIDLIVAARKKVIGALSLDRRGILMIADPRPMSSAPLDGTPVRLFIFAGSVLASF